jgi:8-oxo-dGTP pyrophosphatase MutT (NUDIX family)
MATIGYDVDPVPDRSQLVPLLAAHRAQDADERSHLARMLGLLETRGDPFARDHFVPGHFTASAFVVAPEGDALLLLRHPKLGRWLQPGGHVEAGDSGLLAAARRELLEEVGMNDASLAAPGIFDLDVHRIPALGREPEHEHFDVRFLFRAARRQLRGGPAGEAAALRWFSLDEIAAGASDTSVRRAARKLADR